MTRNIIQSQNLGNKRFPSIFAFSFNKNTSKSLKLGPILLNHFPKDNTFIHTWTRLFMAFNTEFLLRRRGKDEITLTHAWMF